MRTGIYSPITVKLEKCKPESAYDIMEKVFTNIALGFEISDPMTKLPDEYEDKVFKELNYAPVEGKYGYLIFKNDSEHPLEQDLQLDLAGADIIWPEDARDYERFTQVVDAGKTSIILFRKHDRAQQSLKMSSVYIPRKMTEAELNKLVLEQGEKNLFEEG